MPASFGYCCYICQAFSCCTPHMCFAPIIVTDLLGILLDNSDKAGFLFLAVDTRYIRPKSHLMLTD